MGVTCWGAQACQTLLELLEVAQEDARHGPVDDEGGAGAHGRELEGARERVGQRGQVRRVARLDAEPERPRLVAPGPRCERSARRGRPREPAARETRGSRTPAGGGPDEGVGPTRWQPGAAGCRTPRPGRDSRAAARARAPRGAHAPRRPGAPRSRPARARASSRVSESHRLGRRLPRRRVGRRRPGHGQRPGWPGCLWASESLRSRRTASGHVATVSAFSIKLVLGAVVDDPHPVAAQPGVGERMRAGARR